MGGGENRLLHLAKQFVKKGHHVYVFTTSVPGFPRYDELEGIRIFRFGLPHPSAGSSLLASIVYLIMGILRLRWIARLRFDIIESNTYAPSYLAALVSVVTGTPHVMTIHDVYLSDWKFRLGRLLAPLGILIEKGLRFLRRNLIVTVSESSRYKLVRRLGFDRASIEVVPNGIPIEDIRSAKPDREQYHLVYLGRLVPHKNVEHAIEGFLRLKRVHPESKMLIIGTGPEKEKLERIADQLGVSDSIYFTGFVHSQEKVYSLLKSGIVLVNPSSVEGFGTAVLEAMAAGTPPIIYDLSAYRMFAKDHVNAIIVERGDVEGLTNAILELIENEKLRRKLAANGLKTANKFSWSSIANRMIVLYEKVVKGP